LEFHVFDLFSYEVFIGKEKGLNYLGRNVSLTSLFRSMRIPENIIQVESVIANNMKDVYEYFYTIKDKGGEGVILKNIAGFYETKKSKNWIKIKGEYSATLKVVGVILSDSEQFKGMVGKLVCEDKDGNFVVHVGSGLTEEQRKDFVIEDRIVGKLVEVKFNDVQVDDEGNPWLDFPVFIGVRFDKDEADDLQHIIDEIRSIK
jgi:DNA ligase-1